MSTAIVRAFISAIQAKNRTVLPVMLHDDIVQVIPFCPSGASKPWAVFEGKEAVLNYIDTVFTNFTRIQFRELLFTTSQDESVVFLEAQGDFIATKNAMPYCNTYVLKFQLERGLIKRIDEYANPVPIAMLLSAPVGLGK